jgi:hypothetical protein
LCDSVGNSPTEISSLAQVILVWSSFGNGKVPAGKGMLRDEVARRRVGDRRLDTVMQTRWLNTIYDKLYVYHNYFIPVLKQLEKEWRAPTAERQGYVRRQHDAARTPLDRLCDSEANAYPDQCQALLQAREAINPRQLRQDIMQALQHLFAYPGAVPGQVENVYETLAAVESNGLPTDLTAPTTITETVASPQTRKETA